jgi:anti-repressor protein
MNELIKIREENGKQAVSARELYLALTTGGDQSHYSRWAKQNILENSFAIKDIDYQPLAIVASKNQGNFAQDFALTINFAKRLCMLTKTAQGEKVRQYFIECEKRLRQGQNSYYIPKTYPDALMLAAKQAQEIETKNTIIAENKPKVLFADAVATSQRSCLVAELAKIISQNGVVIGQNRLFEWLRQNNYLCSKGSYYNQPTQKAMGLGLFEVKQTSIQKPNGVILVTTTTKVTGKGQIYFVDKFLSIHS